MQIVIPKIVKPLKLGDYAPEFGEDEIMVHVNPTRAELQAYWDLAERARNGEDVGEKIAAWFACLWSQGNEESHWTTEQVLELVSNGFETDPRLFGWLSAKSLGMIADHRAGQKKA